MTIIVDAHSHLKMAMRSLCHTRFAHRPDSVARLHVLPYLHANCRDMTAERIDGLIAVSLIQFFYDEVAVIVQRGTAEL